MAEIVRAHAHVDEAACRYAKIRDRSTRRFQLIANFPVQTSPLTAIITNLFKCSKKCKQAGIILTRSNRGC